jgi:hypothetical protein
MSALAGAALILGGCLVLYMMMDLAVFLPDVRDVGIHSDSVISKGHIRHMELWNCLWFRFAIDITGNNILWKSLQQRLECGLCIQNSIHGVENG